MNPGFLKCVIKKVRNAKITKVLKIKNVLYFLKLIFYQKILILISLVTNNLKQLISKKEIK